jgi:excisionase family DNA binding protein
VPLDPLTDASPELRRLAGSLRERGDLAAYRQAVNALALVLAGRDTATRMAPGGPPRDADLMTISEYASVTGLKAGTVRRAAREGRIPAARHGRVWLIEQAR